VGTTDAGGNYQLTTYDMNDGAMIGTHAVTVKKYGSDADENTEAPAAPLDAKAMKKAIEKSMRESAQQVREAEKKGTVLPSKYTHMNTSDLRKEVIEGENVINIDLVD
jgi:hypothetical protein